MGFSFLHAADLPHGKADGFHSSWKTNVEQKLRMLEDSIDRLSQRSTNAIPEPVNASSSTSTMVQGPTGNAPPPGMPSQQQEQPWEVVMDLNRGPGVIPASVVSEVADASPAAVRMNLADELDLIDRGVITLADAEAFFALYHGRLDHFLYNILAEHDSLASVRRSSALLTASICVVGALHLPSPQYQACYQHFVQLASSCMFSKRNSHDDVRAFCIGAFWLSDISWNLLGIGMVATMHCREKC